MSCSKTNNQTGKLIRKISSKLCLQFCSFQQRKYLSYNNVYRCYAKSTWNCKNIVKSSKKIEVNFWPPPAHKMTPIVLWPIYLKLLLQCTKIQSTGKAVKKARIRNPLLFATFSVIPTSLSKTIKSFPHTNSFYTLEGLSGLGAPRVTSIGPTWMKKSVWPF